ncbi:MAG: serine protein kinase PrkA [Polyangiales bacterium]
MAMDLQEIRALFDRERVQFEASRRVMSMDEYLAMFASEPQRHGRDVATWLRDLFDFYGSETIHKPYGRFTRWRLFDLPWEDASGQREALIGHEQLQREVYRALANFARIGRVNRLVLLHGPNGSAKSTFVSCLLRAMENYSTLDEGALYRFNWVFPKSRGRDGSRIGFGGVVEGDGAKPGDSFAHLDESAIDAKIQSEVRDHPLLALPRDVRQAVLARCFEGRAEAIPAQLWKGSLSHKFQLIFDALFTAYRGDLSKVLAHVQVERWYVSRRYRQGAVTLGPQMAVDAKERQVTADRSLSALPPSLQNVALFEPYGDLVDAAGGLIEYSDLLKRPLEAWKYLLLMIETGEVSLTTSNLVPNVMLIGSSNEAHLDAFREHPEFASFRGRLELVRAGYLVDWKQEKAIYDQQVVPGLRVHVAPHATELAAVFAVLTRLRRAGAEGLPKPLGVLAAQLSPIERADLFALGSVPARYSDDQTKELRAGVETIYRQARADGVYEGRVGASPREIRALLLDAAQHPGYFGLSPFAVLEKIADLCRHHDDFEWLRQPAEGGYHEPASFIEALRERLLDRVEEDLRAASGLADDVRTTENFERYVLHVSASLKGERVLNRLSGRDEPADEGMMRAIETVLGATDAADFRRNLISRVAAWAIDHSGEPVPYASLFPQHLQAIRDAFFQDRRRQVAGIARDVIARITDEGVGLEADALARAEEVLAALKSQRGYEDRSARDALASLLKERFSEIRAGA